MFLDWYVRFRGIDEWPETTGVVQDTELIPGGDGPDGKNPDRRWFRFTYQDEEGMVHQGEVSASEDTDLFPLERGDTFKLRLNPKNAEKTFVAAAYADSVSIELFVTAFIVIAIVLLIDRIARN